MTDPPVQYDARCENGKFLIHATSRNAASFFVRHLTYSPAEFPWMEWDWRVIRPVCDEDLTGKSGNDCSARVIIGFQGDWSEASYWERRAVRREIEETGYEPPGTLLVYVWAISASEGAIMTDPHVGPRARILVATGGTDKTGAWQHVGRNLKDDYRRAFGSEPPPVVSVALLTDTDDTHSQAEAEYAPIVARASGETVPAVDPGIRLPAGSGDEPARPERELLLGVSLAIALIVVLLLRRRGTSGVGQPGP